MKELTAHKNEVRKLASKLQNLSESSESLKIENSSLKTDIIEASDVKRLLENKIGWRGVKGIGWGKGARPMDPM